MSELTPAIDISHLAYAYGRSEAVHDFSLTVPRGKCYGLFGRNGAGKTTTMKCLLNLLRPRAGRLAVLGLDPTGQEVEVKRRLAYVPDQVAFYPWMTIRETFDYLASFRTHWNREIERSLLDRFRLDPAHRTSGLSKGQRTQVALIAGQYLSDAAWGSSLESWNGSSFLGFVALLAGVMCSGAFWTLLSRSIIGGMVLPLAIQVLLAGVITWFVSGTSTVPPEELESRLLPALGAGALVYCALFMHLGWRKFSRVEWREGYTGESVIAGFPALRVKESQPAKLCSSWASLLRKELRLHRPVFLLAVLFTVCWLAALGLRALRPAWEARFDVAFLVILVIYLPFVWLLSGCISLGEEKRLGTWGWHLTLPVSGARQWAVKISFALLTALTLGILLPALVWPAARAPIYGFSIVWYDVPPALLALPVAVFATLLSFWSVTMFSTVVRAVLFTFLGAGILLSGSAMALLIGRETFLFQGVWKWLIVEFQLSPYHYFSDRIIAAGWLIGLTLLLVSLLRQSYVHCRREPSGRIILKCSLVLVISLLLPLWMSADISRSSSSFWSPEIQSLTDNLEEAIAELPASVKEDAFEEYRPVSIEELDGTGILSPETRRWLRGSYVRIYVHHVASAPGRTYVWVEVTFPNGRNFVTIAWL